MKLAMMITVIEKQHMRNSHLSEMLSLFDSSCWMVLFCCHCHPCTLPLELNKILGGPSEILDPVFHMPTQQDPTEEEQHVDEGSHSPIMLDTDEEEQL